MQATLSGIPDPNQRTVMNYLAAVPMRPAAYFCTGDNGTTLPCGPCGRWP